MHPETWLFSTDSPSFSFWSLWVHEGVGDFVGKIVTVSKPSSDRSDGRPPVGRPLLSPDQYDFLYAPRQGSLIPFEFGPLPILSRWSSLPRKCCAVLKEHFGEQIGFKQALACLCPSLSGMRAGVACCCSKGLCWLASIADRTSKVQRSLRLTAGWAGP